MSDDYVPHPAAEAEIASTCRAVAAKLPYDQLTSREIESATRSLRQLELFRDVLGVWVLDGGLLGAAGPRDSRASRPRYLGFIVERERQQFDATTQAPRAVIVDEAYHAVQVELAAPVGDVFIRPEKLVDKLIELFRAREVDFDDHPAFSRAYYVLASDPPLLRQSVPPALLDAFAGRRDLVAEIRGRTLTAMRLRVATEEDGLDIARLALEIATG